MLHRYLLYFSFGLCWLIQLGDLNIIFSLKSKKNHSNHQLIILTSSSTCNIFFIFWYSLNFTILIEIYIISSKIKLIFCALLQRHRIEVARDVTVPPNQGKRAVPISSLSILLCLWNKPRHPLYIYLKSVDFPGKCLMFFFLFVFASAVITFFIFTVSFLLITISVYCRVFSNEKQK